MIKSITTNELKEMTGEGLVIQGCGGDLNEWANGINNILTEEGILLDGDSFRDIYTFKHDGLTNMLFSMEGVNLNLGKLAMWRLQSRETFGGTWLSDYLPNRLGVELAPLNETEQEVDAKNKPPLLVHIENAADSFAGGFTIPLPTDKDTLQPWLEGIGIDPHGRKKIAVKEVRSPYDAVQILLKGNDRAQYNLDELNLLAHKISVMDADQLATLFCIIDSRQYQCSITEIINLAENLDAFDWQPAYSEEMYGEFLLDQKKEQYASGISKLKYSGDTELSALVDYIEELEGNVDLKHLGRQTSIEENGRFSKDGYLMQAGEIREIYHGEQDVPEELRLMFTQEIPVIAKEMDIPGFLTTLHVVAGDFSDSLEHNLGTLNALRSSEYLLLMDSTGAYFTEAAHAYRHGTDAHKRFMNAENVPYTKCFAIHLTEVHGQILGDVEMEPIESRKLDIAMHSIHAIEIEGTDKDGNAIWYSPEEWAALEPVVRDTIQDWRRKFPDNAFSQVNAHLEDLNEKMQKSCVTISGDKFISKLNDSYMQQAQYPQPDMLRISHSAAKEMLAHHDAEVYRLLSSGAEKLVPINAVRHGLWFSENRKFAIKKEDIPKLHQWAERSSKELMQRTEKELNKIKNEPER